jgi:RNA recognition motif-containing protein
MVIKFSSVDDKKKILIPEARLFGLNFRRFKNIKLEEGFAKNTITLVNIPWGVDSKYLESELNDLFKPLGIEITYPKCILEKNYIYIKFDYITEALAAIKLLDNFTFQVHIV